MMKEIDRIAYATLILRLTLGVILIAHGLVKVLIYTMPGAVQFFTSVGFPGWLAYPVMLVEVGGGSLMLGGIATRWVALALIPVMLGVITVHWSNGWIFSNTHGGWEYPAFLAIALIIQTLLGSGAHAFTRHTE